jgi:hypothetical protein
MNFEDAKDDAKVIAFKEVLDRQNAEQNERIGVLKKASDALSIDSKYNISSAQVELDNNIATRLAEQVFEVQKQNIDREAEIISLQKSGKEVPSELYQEIEVKNNFDEDERTKFFKDELEGIVGGLEGMSKDMLKTQMVRMEALMGSLSASNAAEKDFMLTQYKQSLDFIDELHQEKSKALPQIMGKVSDLASEYFDMQSIVSGMVNNNPILMAGFKMASGFLKKRKEKKEEQRGLLKEDAHRQLVMERELSLIEQAKLNGEELSKKLDQYREEKLGGEPTIQREEPTQVEQQTIQREQPTQVEEDDESVADETRLKNQARREASFQREVAREDDVWQDKVYAKLSEIASLLGGGAGGAGGLRGGGGDDEDGFGILDALGLKEGYDLLRGDKNKKKPNKPKGKFARLFSKIKGFGGRALGAVGLSSMLGGGATATAGATAAAGGGGMLKKGLSKTGGLLKNVGRFLGGPAAVAGAGYLGYEIGTALNEGIEKYVYDGKGSIGSSLFDSINGAKQDAESVAERKDLKIDDLSADIGKGAMNILDRAGIVDYDIVGNSSIEDWDELEKQPLTTLKSIYAFGDFNDEDMERLKKIIIKKNDESEKRIAKLKAERAKKKATIDRDATPEPIPISNTIVQIPNQQNLKPAGVNVNNIPVPIPVPGHNRSGGRNIKVSGTPPRKQLQALQPYNSGNSDVSAKTRNVLELIAQGEGTGGQKGYDDEYAYGKWSKDGDKKLTEMTFGEIKKRQKEMLNNQYASGVESGKGSSAIGKYQLITSTLLEAMENTGMTDDDIFTPENQDKLGMYLLQKRGYKENMSPAETEKFLYSASQEWASIEKPGTGRSYYGQGMSITTNDLRSVVSQTPNLSPVEPTAKQTQLAGIDKKATQIDNNRLVANNEPQQASIQTSGGTPPKTVKQGGSKQTPSISSARNNDSTLQRISDRHMSQGFA